MVNSISYKLGQNRLVTGFGRRTCGRGMVRKTFGTIAIPALTYIANKIADVISGSGVHRRRTVHRGASYKITGSGRRPRRTLVSRRRRTVGLGYRKKTSTRRTVAQRKPRRTLLGMGRKRHVQRRRILF